MTNLYEEHTLSLMVPNLTSNKLTYKSIQTGRIYPANAEQTILIEGNLENIDVMSKYKNTIANTAHDPVNPKIRLPDGCSSCKRKVVSYQRLGEYETVVYQCLCGAIW